MFFTACRPAGHILCLFFLSFFLAGTASAQQLVVSLPEPQGSNAIFGTNTTLGWEFTTNRAVTVTALSYYDMNLDGLTAAHEVGIFDSGGTLLTSATVPAGTIAPLVNQFRTVTIVPYLLASGQTYVIGGFTTPNIDNLRLNVTSLSVDSAIQYLGGRRNLSASFAAPNTVTPIPNGLFGPNFAIAAPEIAVKNGFAFFVVLGLLGVAEKRRRRSLPGPV